MILKISHSESGLDRSQCAIEVAQGEDEEENILREYP